MLLVIDVGNSHIVLGLYDGDELRKHWRIATTNYLTADELRLQFSMLLQEDGISSDAITGCCISSVVPQMNTALHEVSIDAFGMDPLMVGPGIKTGLVLQCANPKEVGADRIVNAVGALVDHTGPLIIIDFGTATTFDVITEKSEWRGTVIFPGIQLSANALFEKCAKLPRVEIVCPPKVIGRDTVDNIRAGLTYGYASLVDGLVRKMSKEMGLSPEVIATGGLSHTIAEISECIDVVDPWLTLKGLKAIYEKNRKS